MTSEWVSGSSNVVSDIYGQTGLRDSGKLQTVHPQWLLVGCTSATRRAADNRAANGFWI